MKAITIFMILFSISSQAKEPHCDVFLMGMRMKVNQKFDENTYGAVGKPAGYGQMGRIEYKGLAYSRLTVKTLKSNSFMKSNPQFTHNNSVVGWFNYVGPTKVKLEDGFDADVLVLEECPDVHAWIKYKEQKEERERKIAEAKYLEEQKELEKRKKEEAKKKSKQKKKLEALYE